MGFLARRGPIRLRESWQQSYPSEGKLVACRLRLCYITNSVHTLLGCAVLVQSDALNVMQTSYCMHRLSCPFGVTYLTSYCYSIGQLNLEFNCCINEMLWQRQIYMNPLHLTHYIIERYRNQTVRFANWKSVLGH